MITGDIMGHFRIRTHHGLVLFGLLLNCGTDSNDPSAEAINTHKGHASQLKGNAVQSDSSAGKDPDPMQPYCHTDPGSLLTTYLERDSRGFFLRQNKWMQTALLKPQIVSGWDRITLITGFRIDTLRIGTDRASFRVCYRKVADVLPDTSGFHISFAPVLETRKMQLKNTIHGWRILPPYDAPHVKASYIMPSLSRPDRDSLKARLSRGIDYQ